MQMAKNVVGNVDQRVRKVSISWKGQDEKVSSTAVEAKAGMGRGTRPAMGNPNEPQQTYIRLPNKYKHHVALTVFRTVFRQLPMSLQPLSRRMAPFPRGFLCLMFQAGDILASLLLKQHYSISKRIFQGGDVLLPNLMPHAWEVGPSKGSVMDASKDSRPSDRIGSA